MFDVRALSTAFAVIAFPIAVSCGGSAEGDGSEPQSAAGEPEAAKESGDTASAPKYEGPRGPIDPSTVGTIRGSVRFEGQAPERRQLSIAGTGGCPEHPEPVFEESVVVADGHLANTFVWIKDGLEGWDVPPAADRAITMDQKGCVYVPHVVGMRVGETLLIENSDAGTTHNVNIRSRSNDSMNPLQPPKGAPVEWRPKKKELGVSLECNLHTWMKAWACVVDHPWFTVTADDGTFVLEKVPPGEYVVESWHEKLGKKTRKIALGAGESAEASFAYGPTDKSR